MCNHFFRCFAGYQYKPEQIANYQLFLTTSFLTHTRPISHTSSPSYFSLLVLKSGRNQLCAENNPELSEVLSFCTWSNLELVLHAWTTGKESVFLEQLGSFIPRRRDDVQPLLQALHWLPVQASMQTVNYFLQLLFFWLVPCLPLWPCWLVPCLPLWPCWLIPCLPLWPCWLVPCLPLWPRWLIPCLPLWLRWLVPCLPLWPCWLIPCLPLWPCWLVPCLPLWPRWLVPCLPRWLVPCLPLWPRWLVPCLSLWLCLYTSSTQVCSSADTQTLHIPYVKAETFGQCSSLIVLQSSGILSLLTSVMFSPPVPSENAMKTHCYKWYRNNWFQILFYVQLCVCMCCSLVCVCGVCGGVHVQARACIGM